MKTLKMYLQLFATNINTLTNSAAGFVELANEDAEIYKRVKGGYLHLIEDYKSIKKYFTHECFFLL